MSSRILATLGLLILQFPGSSDSATLRVPSEYATINAGLDAAAAGDTVLVAPGVYDEYETRVADDGIVSSCVAFLKGGIALLSEAGPDDTTLRLDAAAPGACVLEAFMEEGMTLVSGFTVTGSAPGLAGLSYTWSDGVIVEDCVFRDIGTAAANHFGIGVTAAHLEVYRCRFENMDSSSAAALGQSTGTAIVEDCVFVNCRQRAMIFNYVSWIPHDTGLEVRRCLFLDNSTTTGVGAAMAVGPYATILVEDCWFEGNRTIGGTQGGGAVHLGGANSASVTLRGSTFVGNDGGNGFGGGGRLSGVSVLAEGNTFFGNEVELDWSTGASGLRLQGWEHVLRRNLFVSNTGDEAVSLHSGTVTSECNVFWDNPVGHVAGFDLSPTDTVADPLFCDPDRLDFTVQDTSPCLPGFGHPDCTELIGPWGEGCGTVTVEPRTWGRLRAPYRTGNGGTP